ncbi:hypothetical protein PP938_gp139 [Rhizobium phage AF3]|uniref:Uncharacterized protein n=1 Tax=Rhizobium phage AF3 TaxID=2763529 RepID=A0A7G7WWI4_9CAUD|nr:hypothetical protein PP938_gp139 [Rhizobium phage AF3]QNH71578.1 hypothetical protein AF3_139 [Rhizobium phage AF3]
MKQVIVGIKETSPGVFRLTFDRTILGDSRGYSKNDAIREAKNFVARNKNDGDWVGNQWVEHTNVLDPNLEA